MKGNGQKEDRNKISKHRSLAECLQNLYQAEASEDKVRARMWKTHQRKTLAFSSSKKSR